MSDASPHRVRGVILDWAGTTVDHGCLAPAVAFTAAFESIGVPVTLDEARRPMGLHKRDHIRAVSQIPEVAARWREVKGRPCTEDDVQAMFLAFVPVQMSVLGDHCGVIPGVLDAVAAFRERDLKIGTTTGYTAEMMAIVVPAAAAQGYVPDSIVNASEVHKARPAPFMAFRNCENLGIYPMSAVVKIGDTVSDVEEGLNAGMWTVGLTRTGNEVGLSEAEVAALSPAELRQRLGVAEARLRGAGAHYVVESLGDVLPVLDLIEERLRRGDRP